MINPKIVVLVPTPVEAKGLPKDLSGEVKVVICGVGASRCALTVADVMTRYVPSWMILCGVAGVYSGKKVEIGQCVAVEREYEADLGSFSEGLFCPKFGEEYMCGSLPDSLSLRRVSANSVSAAASPFVSGAGADIENMEGAAFFQACQRYGVRFLELRAVSNRVGDPFCNWEMERTLQTLSKTLASCIKTLLNE